MLCKLKVEGQTLRWYGEPEVLAADSIEFVGFEFILPEDWDGYTLHATFQQADKAYTQVLEDRKCTLPSEIGVGNCGIGLFGYQPGKSPRATTNLLNVQVVPSGFIPDGEYPVPPTPDLYSQLLSQLDSKVDEAEQFAVNAVHAAQQAQSHANQVKSEADLVVKLADDVAKKATQASDDSTAAAQAKEAAETAKRLAEAARDAAETAQKAAEDAHAAASQSSTDAGAAKQGAETALKSAQNAAEEAANALSDLRELYQQMQTWAAGVVQDIDAAGSNAIQGVQTAGDAQVQRVEYEATQAGDTQVERVKSEGSKYAQMAVDAAKVAQDKAAEIAGKSDQIEANTVGLNELKQDISNLRFGDPYDGVDLVAKFADEISGYTDPGAWIRARIRANNFGCIHVNDYIPFTTTNGLKFKARVAGIDPYYEYGDFAIGHHIDFICEELWPTLHPINPFNYNNGLIPTENVTSDGTATQYVLTKPMYGVAKVTLSGTNLTGWTYDKDTYALTFSTAPAAGTMVVTGTGSEYPWLASDAYLYVNSLAGHVPNGTYVNPAIKRVDYTNDGIYHYLPDWLKAVIIEKRFVLNKRYSISGVLSDENDWGWTNIGKIWFPTEVEVYGYPVWGSKGGYGLGGSIQYPLFIGNMLRLKKGSRLRDGWWLLLPDTTKDGWCFASASGIANHYAASHDRLAEPVCFRIG